MAGTVVPGNDAGQRTSRRRRSVRPTKHSALESFWDHNELGVYFYRRQAYDLAIAEFERAVGAAVFPLAVLYMNLGAAYLGNKMYHEAQSCLEKGLTIDPDNQQGHWFLARALKAEHALSEASAEFERAYELDPDSPEGRWAEEEVIVLRQEGLREDDIVWRKQNR